MAAYEAKTGGSVLAIAHNGNLRNGTMFPVEEAFGKKLDAAYCAERAKWERLYEATQTKGDGEAHPFLSPTDERNATSAVVAAPSAFATLNAPTNDMWTGTGSPPHATRSSD